MAFRRYVVASAPTNVTGRDPEALWLINDLWENEVWVESKDLPRSRDYAVIQKHLRITGRILEGGSGLGQWVKFLANLGHQSFGLDISMVANIKAKRLYPDVNVIQGNLLVTPFKNDTFDLIVSFGAVEHDPHGPSGILEEFRRILKKDGALWCTVPCLNLFRRTGLFYIKETLRTNLYLRRKLGRPAGQRAFFEYLFTRDEFRDILCRAGFSIMDIYPLGPYRSVLYRSNRLFRDSCDVLYKIAPWSITHMMGALCT